MPLRRAIKPFTLISAVLLAAALGGCSNKAGVFEDNNEGGFFTKKMFETPSWARPAVSNVSLGPTGPGAKAAGCRADCVMSGSFTGEEESGSRSP